MSLEQIEIVIDANGLARTEQVFKSVDKYLERIHRRVDKLGRLRVTPMARLTDRVTPQLEKINRALNRLTGQVRRVTIVPVFKFEALAEISAQLEATLKAALELKAALDFRAAMNLKASLDVKAALQAVASLKASLTAALNVKVALKIKASLSLIVKGIFQKKCLPCPPDKTKDKCPPGKGDKGKGKCPPAKGKKGSPAKDKCSPGKGKQKKGGAGKGPLKCPPCPPGKDKAGGRRDRGGKDSRRRLPANRGRAGGLMPEPKGPKLPKAPAGKSKGIIGMARAGIEAISGGGSAKGLGKFGKVAGTAAGFLGKVFKPVGLLTDAASILGAKPGEERNKAIRSAAGGWAGAAAGAATGAAIGSIIPGVGTAIGGLIGGALGGIGGSAIAENIGSIGKKVGGVGKKIGGWFGFGKKKKPAEDPAALPTPATPSQPQGPVGPPMAAAAAGSPGVLNVNLPAGAVQLIMQGLDLNYEELSALIGSKIADAIRRAMENKA